MIKILSRTSDDVAGNIKDNKNARLIELRMSIYVSVNFKTT